MAWVADVSMSDGLSLQAVGVTVVEIRRGKAVHVRDYMFEPTLLELVWGKRTEAEKPVTTAMAQSA